MVALAPHIAISRPDSEFGCFNSPFTSKTIQERAVFISARCLVLVFHCNFLPNENRCLHRVSGQSCWIVSVNPPRPLRFPCRHIWINCECRAEPFHPLAERPRHINV